MISTFTPAGQRARSLSHYVKRPPQQQLQQQQLACKGSLAPGRLSRSPPAVHSRASSFHRLNPDALSARHSALPRQTPRAELPGLNSHFSLLSPRQISAVRIPLPHPNAVSSKSTSTSSPAHRLRTAPASHRPALASRVLHLEALHPASFPLRTAPDGPGPACYVTSAAPRLFSV